MLKVFGRFDVVGVASVRRLLWIILIDRLIMFNEMETLRLLVDIWRLHLIEQVEILVDFHFKLAK